ncbi:hypothetical protein [Clostridium perfringens]|uniref:hypothetical protein n=1 Tax=Clostridium perfringens TaxID=1502 RepID=UPI000707D7ED|nr:hypothetical protein [Clostridium perfringens]KQC91323.1 hypothetical protein AM596_15450 [Clostridium perfringens CP4]
MSIKELITKKEKGDIYLTNDLTREIDNYLKDDYRNDKYDIFNTYIYDHSIDGVNWAIRYPGATRGGISVDKNMIITDIRLNTNEDSIYKSEVKTILNKYIGMKLIIIK